MDRTLAELFGTLAQPPSTEELQKTAELELLAKIAEDNGIDLTKLSDDQIMEAYAELHSATAAPAPAAAPDLEKEAAEMFDNSVYMGKIMAHSFVQELGSIQKAAEEAAANPLAEKIREMKEEKKEEKEEKKEEKAEEKGEEKTAAEVNALVEKRAYELLAEAGLINQDGTIQPPPIQKVAQEDIDRAALQVLESMGYPVVWNQ
jgi:uncharacterized protein with von Willebrand factor type A (vWA) domain